MPEEDPQLPLVSIVTPSFNQGAFIAETIDSVLAQDYPRIEYIVMDGGSTDDTISILDQYGDRVRWYSERDAGQSDAIRKGFDRTSGEIIAWLNADDLYLPSAVSRAVDAFRRLPEAGFIYGKAEFMDRDGRMTGEQLHVPWSFDKLLNRFNYVPQAATFFRRSAYDAVGGISADLHYLMDYDLWLKLGRAFPASDVPEALARVRMYPETKTASGGLTRMDEMRRMIRRHGRDRLPDWHQWDSFRANVLAGAAAIRSGQRVEGLRRLAYGSTAPASPIRAPGCTTLHRT